MSDKEALPPPASNQPETIHLPVVGGDSPGQAHSLPYLGQVFGIIEGADLPETPGAAVPPLPPSPIQLPPEIRIP